MLSVELTHLAEVLDAIGQMPDLSKEAKTWSSRLNDAIWTHTVTYCSCNLDNTVNVLQVVDNIFAYEVNGKLYFISRFPVNVYT